jgi:hypothetical protein
MAIWTIISRVGRVVCLGACAALVIVVASEHLNRASASDTSLTVSSLTGLQSGGSITVSIGANSIFTPHSHVNILECADPGGSSANLPKDITTCDGNSIQGNTVLVAVDGSFSTSYTVYSLPNALLGEQSNAQPICDQTHQCVLYVGQNQNDFTAPKLFSPAFAVAASSSGSSTSSTTSPSTTSSTNSTGTTVGTDSAGTGGSSTTVVASATGSGSSTTTQPGASASAAAPILATPAEPAGSSVGLNSSSSPNDPSALASTGAPAELLWMIVCGLGLFAFGSLGRRVSLRVGQ